MISNHSIQEIFSLDIRSLALFRILLGLAIILDVINRILFVPAFYSDQGIVPRELIDLGPFAHMYHFQLMMVSGSEWFAYLLLGVFLICGVLLFIGYKTRLMSILSWFLLCSVILRDPLTTHAGDTLLIILLFWGIFLPLNHSLSVDKLISGFKTKHSTFTLASVALYLQFCLLYITTGLYKAKFSSWLDGSHLYNTFSRFDYVEPLAFLLYPNYELLSFLTHFALYLELFGPFLFFIPFFFVSFRMIGICLFIGLQASIGLTMDVGLFPLVSIAGILVFLPSKFWNRTMLMIPKSLSQKFNQLKFFMLKIFPEKNIESQKAYPFKKRVNIFLVFAMLYVTTWNVAELSSNMELSETFKKPGYILRLNQKWSMFASPVNRAEYLALEVTLKDGTKTDLMKDIRSEQHSSDDFHHQAYSNYRWRIFFSNKLRTGTYSQFWETLTDYKFKEMLVDPERIEALELVGYWHEIGKNYDHSELKRSIIYKSERF